MMAATIILGRALSPVEMLIGGWRGLVDARGAWARLDAILHKRRHRERNTAACRAGSSRPSASSSPFPAPRRPRRGVSFELQAGESMRG